MAAAVGLRWWIVASVLTLVFAAGCRQDMHDQPKLQPLEASAFFDDQRASRQPVPGAVARGGLHEDTLLYTGYSGGELSAEFPFEVTRETMLRGRERFEIFCSPCHGKLGDGQGAVVRRGFERPPSYHIDRLRRAPIGHLYDVIANGKGRMYSFNDRVEVRDRWAIAAYIRALQLSQAAPVDELPAATAAELRAEVAR